MTPLIIVGAGALGLLCGMAIGFLFVVAVGGVEPGDSKQYVVHGLVFGGMIVGVAIGWWLA